ALTSSARSGTSDLLPFKDSGHAHRLADLVVVCDELGDELRRTERQSERVMERNRADEMRLPAFEVTPHGFVAVVSVDPQKPDGRVPAGRDHLGGKIYESHLLDNTRTEHVLHERLAILRPEAPAHDSLKGLVRLDRIHRDG